MEYYCQQCGCEVDFKSTDISDVCFCSTTCEDKYMQPLLVSLKEFEEQVLREKREKINKYLTEALTEKSFKEYPAFTNFHTWDGFGKLFTWAKEQIWWKTELFHNYYSGCTLIDVSYDCTGNVEIENFHLNEYLINPTRFAYAVYNFLSKEDENA